MFDYRRVNLKLIPWLGETWMVSDWSSWLTQYVIPIQIQFSNKHIWAIVKTLGSRKGHPQIWEGSIAYHTFVQ